MYFKLLGTLVTANVFCDVQKKNVLEWYTALLFTDPHPLF